MLYQVGYLTIKEYRPDIESYLIGFPNCEVSEGLLSCLLPKYLAGSASDRADISIEKLRRALREKDDLSDFGK